MKKFVYCENMNFYNHYHINDEYWSEYWTSYQKYRNVVKSEFSTSATTHTTHFSVMIYYVPFEDIRDAKIDNILEIK